MCAWCRHCAGVSHTASTQSRNIPSSFSSLLACDNWIYSCRHPIPTLRLPDYTSQQIVTRVVKMDVISDDVTRKFSSRYWARASKNDASDRQLTSKFGVVRQICREIARHVGNTVHLNLSTVAGKSRCVPCVSVVSAQPGCSRAGRIPKPPILAVNFAFKQSLVATTMGGDEVGE